jgi:hypothetical protein
MYILALGLVRLTFGFGDMSLKPWMMLVLTHVLEGAFWWTLALQPSFNKSGLTVAELASEAVVLKLPGGFQTMLQLIGVPFLIVIYLVLGPKGSKKKQQ